jgi:transposase
MSNADTPCDISLAPGMMGRDTVDAGVVDVKRLGCLGLLANIWDELGFTELIDASVPAGNAELSAGIVLKALVLNALGGRDPLYRVRTWAEQVPLGLLLGRPVDPDQLNDTTLGRQLDRVFDAKPEALFNNLSLRVIKHERVDCSRLHADTTSRLLFGEYKHPEEGAISITRGHSKDHRPDLLQVMYGVACSADGVPVAGQLLSGNTSDKTWHGRMLSVVNAQTCLAREGERRRLHYVGDSALATQENFDVAAAHGITLTGRLPRTFSLHESIVTRVLHDASEPLVMQPLGTFSDRKGASSYEGCSVEKCTLMGHTVQLGVYRSTPVNDAAEKLVLRRHERIVKVLSRAISLLIKQRFDCEKDAHRALEAFLAEHEGPHLTIEGQVVAEEVTAPRPRGRPTKNAPVPTTTRYRIETSVSGNREAAETATREAGFFVLVHTGTEPMSARDMLAAYKGQIVVETRFPFLKDPAWADVFFAKHPRRVEVIGYLLLIALLLWTVWERRVRLNYKASGETPLIDTTGMRKPNPTATVCRHIMADMKVVRRRTSDGWSGWLLAAPPSREQARVARFSTRVLRATGS